MTFWVFVVALALIPVAPVVFLRRQATRIGPERCETCGEPIAHGWVIAVTMDSTGDPMEFGGHSAMAAYWCRRHRPDDPRAVPWSS